MVTITTLQMVWGYTTKFPDRLCTARTDVGHAKNV